MTPEPENEIFNLAFEVVENTSCNLFLTGKAGTGKTTFLQHIAKKTKKNIVVLAPTGVAAVKAGGVTLHSFFQLPLLSFIPEHSTLEQEGRFVNRYSLFRGLRWSSSRIKMVKELDLLIIDEVSMVRSDILDMMDELLRHFLRNQKPFGGVQLLLIGDMYQLPPVVKEDDWRVLRKYYKTPYFFHAKALEKNELLYLELKTVYRQKDENFIRLLNKIRNNDCNADDLKTLNLQHKSPKEKKGITLVTHNQTAEVINREELRKLEGRTHKFPAEVSGLFPESSYPGDNFLEVKTGARVMLIKNDTGQERRYYNGRLGTITKIEEDIISIELSGTKEIIPVTKEKWKNSTYKLSKESGKIEEQEIGSFVQFPIRLAWAVTIHKSQGLTFDEVTIDAGRAFASGQVYVALSRCRTLEGIHLLSPLVPANIIIDQEIIAFSKKETNMKSLLAIIEAEKIKSAARYMLKAFFWSDLVEELEGILRAAREQNFTDGGKMLMSIEKAVQAAREQQAVSLKFSEQLERRLSAEPPDASWLNSKVPAAKKFFIEKIQKELVSFLSPLRLSKGTKKLKDKKFVGLLKETESSLRLKMKAIENASFLEFTFPVEIPKLLQPAMEPKASGAPKKGESMMMSLTLYREGRTIPQIAEQREMAVSTIEGHLSLFVGQGVISIFDFLNQDLFDEINSIANEKGSHALNPIKAALGDRASYGQIKMVIEYLKMKTRGTKPLS